LEPLSCFDGDDNSPAAFCLPKKQVQWAHPAMSIIDFDGVGTTAGYILPIYQKLVPRTGCLWPVGRDSLLALIGRPVGTWDDIRQYEVVADSGPLGHLTSALALAKFSPRVSQKLASQGAKRLSAKALQADIDPLLEGDSWLGRNILSLAEALRGLEDSEIEALVRLFADERHRREIADALLLLKADSKIPVRDVLPDVCERLWRSTVKRSVETRLGNLAGGKSWGTSGLAQDLEFDPFKFDAKSADVKTKPKVFDFKFDSKNDEIKFDPPFGPK
jgi:hypothetical protein